MESRLILGDCLEILPMLPDMYADAILTDIPYGTTTCKWDVVIPFAPMWEQIKRLCKGAFVTTASQPFTSVLIMSNLDWFKYEWVWRKSKPSNYLNAKNKPMPNHENVLVFSPLTTANGSDRKMLYNPQMQAGKPYKRIHNVDPRRGYVEAGSRTPWTGATINEGLRYPNTVIEIPNGNNHYEHPTQKPVALYEYLIKTYTNEGDTVLDFCMGSGTTGVACVNLNRNFIGIEKESKYFEIAQKRIEQAKQQTRMFA